MAVDYQTVTSTTEPSAVLKPYLQYGLSEAQRLYQAGGTPVVAPSGTTQQAMQAMQNRAMQGSPLLGSAQAQQMGTVQGDYLSGNPFFQGAFQPAAQAATGAFNQAIGNIGSQASRAGRYGSGAMENLQTQAAGQLAQNLTNTAGQLAYQNYAQERARQEAAAGNAPTMAGADYGDIQKLLGVGQLGEQYQQAAYNQPQQALTSFLGSVQGMPMGQSSSQTNPYYTNTAANNLGMLSGIAGIGSMVNSATNGGFGNWLSGLWG
jgi:hypothetical protein